MKISPKDRHSTVTRRGLFSLSSGRVVSEVTKPRSEMTLTERVSSDRRAVTHSMAAARTACILAEQKASRRRYEIDRDCALQVKDSVLARHRPLNRSRLSRRTFVAAAAATVLTTKAFADTPFTSFAFPGAGFPTNRTMPARIADIFNILDFGADPTQATNSQPAIQAAITKAASKGIIFFPIGSYRCDSAILIPQGGDLSFLGEGSGSGVVGSFNGFVFDSLSDPYNPACIVNIERLSVQNGFVGNLFSVEANGTWSASGSPVNITLSGSNPGVAAGGALWVGDSRLSNNSVFIGMITSVASWPTVTVASAAVGSGATSDLAIRIIQCYATATAFVSTGTVTTPIASPGIVNWTGSNFAAGTGVSFSGGTLPTGITSGVTYYVLSSGLTANSFKIAATVGGTAINFTGTSSGTQTGSVTQAILTMSISRPAGIGSGLYYVYDYEQYLADPRFDYPLGVASWDTGALVTFTPSSRGIVQGSVGSSDRLWFAPVAGALRLSSVVQSTVRQCQISGFTGLTSSEDKVPNSDQSSGSAQGFHILSDTSTYSNPAGFAGLLGQTGIYLTNNSLSINTTASGHWCSHRLSGTSCGIVNGQFEVNYFGIIIGGNFTTSNGSLSAGWINGCSMESNLQALYCKGGSVIIENSGCSCFALNPLGGFYIGAFAGALINVNMSSNFGSSNYGLYIGDANANLRGTITIQACFVANNDNLSNSWKLPAQAWWGTCIASNNPALVYAYAKLPGVGGNPAAIEGDEYNIFDSNTATWGATAAAGGSNRVRVRFNGTNWTVMGA